MAEQIKAIIGADISELKSGIFKAEQELLRLKQSRAANIKVGLDTTKLNGQISSLESRLVGLNKTASPAATAISKVGTAAQTTAGQMSQMDGAAGEVASSAVEVTGAISSGGLTVALTALVAGLKLAYDWYKRNQEEANKYTKALEELRVNASKTSGEEIAQMNALVAVAQNETIARKKRLIAVQELQNEYPAYFGNLSNEEILTGNLKKTTAELTEAIIARAEASAIADEIGKLAAQKLQAQIAKEKEIIKLKKAQASSKVQISSGGTLGADANISASSRVLRIASKIKEENQKITDLGFEQYKLSLKLNQETEKSIALTEIKATKAKKATKATKVNPNAGNKFTPFLQDFTGAVVPEIALTFKDPTQGFAEWNSKIILGLTSTELAWQNTVENIGSLMETAIEGGIFNIGDAIGNALVNGDNVLQAAGSALLQTLGGFISSIAKEMIEFGVLTAAFGVAKEALSKAGVSGVVAIAAGIALAAVGAAISASGKKVASTASGNGGSGGGGGSTANYGSSSTSFSGGGIGGGTVVFEIAGTTLIGVLNNTTERNLRLGGR